MNSQDWLITPYLSPASLSNKPFILTMTVKGIWILIIWKVKILKPPGTIQIRQLKNTSTLNWTKWKLILKFDLISIHRIILKGVYCVVYTLRCGQLMLRLFSTKIRWTVAIELLEVWTAQMTFDCYLENYVIVMLEQYNSNWSVLLIFIKI